MGQASHLWREEEFTRQFYDWEMRGRGWKVWNAPVSPEPAFLPFPGYRLPRTAPIDDGRKHTFISGLLARLSKAADSSPAPEADSQAIEEPEPRSSSGGELVELQLSLPRSRSVPTPQGEQFLRHVCRTGESLTLEILGTERETVLQWVASPRAVTRVKVAVETCFPGLVCAPVGDSVATSEALAEAWHDSESNFVVVELGLEREFMLPLDHPRGDLLATVVAAMDGFGKGELGLVQIMFEPVKAPWREHMIHAVKKADGQPFFHDRGDLVRGAEEKTSSPLFAVVVRLVACASELDRTWECLVDLAAPLSAFCRPGSNHFIPLHNHDYPRAEHEQDIVSRQSRRSGMLFNMEELLPLILPPVTSLSPRLRRETKTTRAAPEMLRGPGTLNLGVNRHAGISSEVFLSSEHRVRHMHVVGASGRGKSTMLLNLIRQDMERGEGLAVFDPHGDLVDAVLGLIPEKRVNDVVLVDPSDEEHVVGLNILGAHSDFERNLLSSDLTSIFRRLSTSWGDQMDSVLRNAILAFLESSRGGTLLDLRRFLLDVGFRKEFLSTVADPEIVFYWERAFPQLGANKSIGPILTRLEQFLAQKPIRYMVSQEQNPIDFSEVIDRGRILLIKLPQGLIGRENTSLLGSLITAKLQMAAMSRQRMAAGERRDFWCYMDEFQHFITTSMGEILVGARKYRLGLILAHQDLHQLDADRNVASAVLSNCHTRVVFTVGDADARTIAEGFTHFEARDLTNLPIGEAVCRVERSDFDFNLSIPNSEPIDGATASETRNAVIAASRHRYARPRSEVESELLRKWQAPHEEAARVPPTKTKAAAGTPVLESAVVSETPKLPEPADEVLPPPAEASKVKPLQIPKPISDLGRGGMIHRDAQNRIKSVSEDLGFRATLESQIGTGGADLLLERDDLRIAVEISVSTSVSHELGNLLKCLTGNYAHIAFIGSDLRKAEQLAERLRERASEADASRIGFYQVETFVDYLRALPKSAPEEAVIPRPSKPGKRQVKGWTVKTKLIDQTSEEERVREDEAIKAIAEALRKPSLK